MSSRASPDWIESSMSTSARPDAPLLELPPDRIIDRMWLSELNVASRSLAGVAPPLLLPLPPLPD